MAQKQKDEIIRLMELMPTPVVYDDRTKSLKEITGLVEFCDSSRGLACCFDECYYLLYQCVIDNSGMLHCTTFPIGNILWGARPDEKILKVYNECQRLSAYKIKCIHYPDGSKVYPEE